MVSRNHRLPLEPEIEQVTVDEQRPRTARQRPQKRHELTLGVSRASAKVDVGDHVARRGEHSLILASPRRLYKPWIGGHSPVVSPQQSSIEFRVRYAETDQMGIVYHA